MKLGNSQSKNESKLAQQSCTCFPLVRGLHVTNENTPFENNLLRHFTFIFGLRILHIGKNVRYSFIWCLDWTIITNNNLILSYLNTQYKETFIHCEFSVFYSWEFYRNSAIRSLPSFICWQFGLKYYLLRIISEGVSVVSLISSHLSKIWHQDC
jgi:hypothetical protein